MPKKRLSVGFFRFPKLSAIGGDRFGATASATMVPQWFQAVKGRPLPFPPLFDPEQNLKDASKVGEISGTRFAFRSAQSQRHLPKSSRPQRGARDSLEPTPLIWINDLTARIGSISLDVVQISSVRSYGLHN